MHMDKTRIIALGAFLAAAVIILAFVPPPSSRTEPPLEGPLLGIFEGTVPCADCPGIDMRLTLVEDSAYSAEGAYELSLTYLERSVEPFVTKGRWTTERGTPSDPDATVYALDPDMPDRTQRFLRVDADTVRILDREGNEIDSSLPLDLTLVSEAAVMPERATLVGTQTCLPHRDTSGPQTLECAIGFAAEDGEYYALDLGPLESMESRALIESGARVEVEGTMTPGEMLSSDQWMRYDMVGVMSVTSVRAL